MKIQLDIPIELNKKLKIDKVNYGLISLQETVIENLSRYYKLMESDLRDNKGNKMVIE